MEDMVWGMTTTTATRSRKERIFRVAELIPKSRLSVDERVATHTLAAALAAQI
jgi:hypothetical protein